MFKIYWSIFWRTFAGLAASALLAAQAWDWSADNVPVNTETLGFALLAAAIGGLIAAGYAFVQSPAVTPIEKAIRAAVQALLGTAIATTVVTNTSDLLVLGDLLVPSAAAVVLAFFVTYFANQGGTADPADSEAKEAGFDQPAA